jgi:hypothetical protein
MTSEQKLKDALQHINELTDLIEGNEYQQFLYQHLISIEVELKRQLTNT